MYKNSIKNIGLQFFAEGEAESEVTVNAETVDTIHSEQETVTANTTNANPPADNKQEQEIAKLKAALDKATKEAADYKRQFRATKTAEEQRAEEEREKYEAMQNRVAELERERDISNISKRAMALVSDETVAGTLAEAMVGAADIDAIFDEIQKAWSIKEKKLRQEFGKIPAPVAGEDAPTMSKEDISKMGYKQRAEFAAKYPETYQKIMNIN